ncbi:MAG: glycerophosphodiester phosphodiesterase family protein [Hymenobacteraceae bacterium]|nr:glycerophosphodiester phosphodiesterase family protein [Hymenobacteraceae bacterium]MDX5480480.1 glycerophosphodiester phosphodiesterase family protein [Hymenobacteraceae bacterium]
MKKLSLLLVLLALLLQSPAFAQHYIHLKTPEQLYRFMRYTPDRRPLISAHRGGPMPGFPENCLETFEHTLRFTPAIIELDPQLTKDSVAVLMHDDRLDRTTTGTGMVTDHTYAELLQLRLRDPDGKVTPYKIPTLEEAILWARGKAVLSIDIKRSINPELIEALIRRHRAESYCTVISYDMRTAQRYHQLNPKLMISVSVRGAEDLQRLREAGVPYERMMAFVGVGEPQPEVYRLLHEKGIMCTLGTMGNLDRSHQARQANVFARLVRNGADILATDLPIEAAEAIEEEIPGRNPQQKYIRAPKKQELQR